MTPKKNTKTITVSWATRKKLALNAFTAFLVYTLLYWFALPPFLSYFGISSFWITAITDSYTWFALTMSAIILGYMGFTTLPFVGKGGKMLPMQPSDNDQDDLEGKQTEDELVDPTYKFNQRDL